MSKIGRRPISINSGSVEIKGQEVHYKGPKANGIYLVPDELQISLQDNKITLTPKSSNKKNVRRKDVNRVWGLHKALLANTIRGSQDLFLKEIDINGLGFKAVVTGNNVTFSLGYSHKIDFSLPKGVTLETDKTGQRLQLKSFDKELLGQVASKIRSLRPPEPYKGTGIKYKNEVLLRKAGKAKA